MDAHGLGGEGAGLVRPVVGLGQQALVEVLAGEPGVLQPGGLQNGLAHVVVKVHTADRLHHRLGQGEAVVAVDAEARVRRQPLGGELLQQGVMGACAGLAEQHGVREASAQDAGGVVQQHPNGDVLVTLVRHLKSGRYRVTGASRETLPSSASCITATVV